MCPKKKNTAWMKDVVQKFRKLENLVVDACAVTISVPMTCMLLLKQRRFIRCKVDSSRVTEAYVSSDPAIR